MKRRDQRAWVLHEVLMPLKEELHEEAYCTERHLAQTALTNPDEVGLFGPSFGGLENQEYFLTTQRH
jgi:hypothetical protein